MSGSNALTVKYNGNVGIGTTTPSSKLSIIGSESGTTPSPLLRIENTGPAYQARIVLTDGNTNDGLIGYQGGFTTGTQYLGFGLGSSIDKMVLTASNNLLIGTTTDNGNRLQVNGNIRIAPTGTLYSFCQTGVNAGLDITNTSNNTSANAIIFRGWDGSITGSIQTYVNLTTYNTSSDYRLKYDLKEFNGLSLINSIKTYDFKWKLNNERMYGVLAHELQSVLPYAVTGEKDGKETQGVDYSKIVPLLVKAIQELNTKIENLK